MTRKTVVRLLLGLAALFVLLAARSSAMAQSLRWPDVDPATTSEVLWYAGSIMRVVLALALAGYAIRPGKVTLVLLTATAVGLLYASFLLPPLPPHTSSVHGLSGLVVMLPVLFALWRLERNPQLGTAPWW